MDVPNPRCSLRAKALIGNIRAGIRPALGRPVITPVISLPANPIDAARVGP